ncbi:hypothetical protein JW916_12280 [Candidatus Sumerlaeota bacterium]|nr:hypothetical protein [Candidatus Sumerlaeota bacterium]
MVDAYVTTLASLTLAVGPDRLLVEDAESNGILSLHPAYTPSGAATPRRFERVQGFAAQADRLTVTWEPVSGLGAETTLTAIGKRCLRLDCRFTPVENKGAAPSVGTLHPVYFPNEGPGACALGSHPLRSLILPSVNCPARLVRVHGERLRSAIFGAWFADSGTPSLLLAEQAPGEPPRAVFSVEGARGRIASLRIDCVPARCPTERQETEPETIEPLDAPSLRLTMGDRSIREALDEWVRDARNPSLADAFAAFDPAGEIESLEDEAPEENVEEPQEESIASQDPPGVEGPEIEPQQAIRETPRTVDLAECSSSGRRTALFRRAWRQNEGAWPRWGSGRRRAPAFGGAPRRIFARQNDMEVV